MNDFWSRKLGGRPTQAPPSVPQQAAPASARPWWDQTTAPIAPGPQQPAQGAAPPGSYEEFQAAQYQQYLAQQQQQQLLVQRSLQKAPSSQQSERCPNCDSGDYAATAKAFTRNGEVSTKRCFDCGYPVLQRTSGMGAMTGVPMGGHARQVAHGGAINNFIAPVVDGEGRRLLPAEPAFMAEHGGPGR